MIANISRIIKINVSNSKTISIPFLRNLFTLLIYQQLLYIHIDY